jgi:uncharacterized membrane protein
VSRRAVTNGLTNGLTRGLVGLAAGGVVVAALSGWGQPLERPAGGQDPAAARAVTAVTSDAPDAAAALPGDFADVVGYRPATVRSARGTAAPTRADGGCTSPFGPTSYGFGGACRQHDLGYDLLRYAAAKGEPLGPWARRAVDDHFAATMRARCGGPACLATASLYSGVVRFNSWRQGWGTPVVEGLGTVLPPVGAGVVVALLVGSARLRRWLRDVLAAVLSDRRPVRAARRRLAPAGDAVARIAAPRAGRLLVAATALAVASQPGLIPRPPAVQALVAALAAVNAYGVAALLGWASRPLRRFVRGIPELTWPVTRRALGAVLVATTAGAYFGQLQLSRATGMAAPSLIDQVLATAGAAGLAVAATGTIALFAAGVRRVARPAAAVLLVPAMLFGGPGTAAAASAGQVARDAAVGSEGRQFLAATPAAADITRATGRAALAPVRVYVGLGQAATPRERAALAVRELEARRAFERAVILVEIPTGSGWVNNASASALEHVYGGDTATVAVQYASMPSWAAYVRGGEGAQESARALVDAINARIARQPADRRPKVLVYGESLGAWGGMTAYPEPGGVLRHVDRALWVGIPAEAPDVTPVPGRLATLDHPDDPVPAWSPDLLVRPSDEWPHPWLPVVTFWQVTGDVIAALETPDGHGHRYGPELVDEWWQLARPDPAEVPTAAPADRLDEVRSAVRR